MTTPVPISNPGGSWATWNYNDIYTGPTGSGTFVPKVNDLVVNIQGTILTWYVVTAVSAGSMITTLAQCLNPSDASSLSQTDILFGVSPTQPDTFRIYIDKSVIPYRMTIDSRYVVPGSEATSFAIFEGTNLGVTGNVISATYDTSGAYTGKVGSLELIATTLYTNYAVQVPKSIYTSADLADGEVVTAVFYNTAGGVCSKRQLLVENTGFVRSTNGYARAVIGIGIISPFLSSTNSTVIDNPINVQLTVANLIGIVYYSDGTSSTMAIDGVKFSIAGLSSYTPTVVGQSYPIVATYTLQAGEVGYGLSNANVPHVSASYSVVATAPNLSYQVRLFAYPVWTGSTYTLSWFLYDMNRSQATNVTSYVTLASGSATFSPAAYGTRQTLTAQLNLNQVQVYYSSYTYTQTVDILLESPGTYRQTAGNPPNWYVSAVSGTSPMFGAGVYATAYSPTTGTTQINLAGLFAGNYTGWLQAYCANAEPMISSLTETVAPTPTHFTVLYNGISNTYTIDQWSAVLTISQTFVSSSTLYVEFFRRTTQVDLQIAIAGVPIYATNSSGTFL